MEAAYDAVAGCPGEPLVSATRPKSAPLAVFAAALLCNVALLWTGLASTATAGPTESGQWVAVRRSVDSVGLKEGCKSDLEAISLPGRVDVRRDGSVIALSADGFSVAGDRCADGDAEVDRWSAGSAWRITCADEEVKRETLFAFVGDRTLEVRERVWSDETGCKGAALLTTASYAPADGVRAGDAPPACEHPGAPTRITVTPPSAVLRPGGSICFRAEARDLNGCSVPFRGTLVAHGPTHASIGEVDDSGCLEAPESVPASSIVIAATDGSAVGAAVVDLVGFAGTATGTRAIRTRSTTDLTTIIGAALVVGLACAAAVLLGHFITLWSRRRHTSRKRIPVPQRGTRSASAARRPVATAGAPATGPPGKVEVAVSAERLLSGEVAHGICPLCTTDYDNGERFCLRDGSQLMAAAEVQGSQGAFCPKCHRGFEPGTQMCPHDGEELGPYPLRSPDSVDDEEEGERASSRRICPRCATRYTKAAHYCGADGSELVFLN